MMPVKDTVEKLAPTSAPSGSQTISTGKAETGGLRSDAVSLEVPVRVHGSRVTEVMRDVTPHTEPFEEQTSTMIVFPQGGVLKMTTVVSVGQMLVVTNLKSGQDAICRVLKVRAYAETQSYVEVEFTHRQVGYWGVQFLSDPVEAPKKNIPAAVRVPVNPSAAFEAASAPQAPVNKVSAPPVRVSEAANSTSRFVGIGAQEDVQLAATPTLAPRSVPPVPVDFKTRPVESPRQAVAAGSPLSPAPVLPASSAPPVSSVSPVSKVVSPSVEELRGDSGTPAPEPVESEEPVLIFEDSDEPVVDLPVASATSESRTFGDFATRGGTAANDRAGKRAAAREMFGVPLESEKTSSDSERSQNPMLVAVGVALLATIGAGGYFFFHQHAVAPTQTVAPASQQIVPAAPIASAVTQPAQSGAANVVRTPPLRTVTTTPVAPVREQPPVETRQAARSEAPAPASSASVALAAPAVTETHRPSGNVPSLFGALNAHPVASHSAVQDDQAPAIPVAAAAPVENLAVIAQPSVGLPAPPASGKAPRLLSSVAAVYPDFARQRGISGSVVMQATVEPNGAVGAIKVLSGPQPLREAALHALRQWKYEPGKVDGQNAEVDVTVTLHFGGK